jgi:CRISPR-associated protein Csd1
MLLQALHQYAKERNLLADLPFQRRTVHLLIPLNADGSPRGAGFVPLRTPVVRKDKTKEEPGRQLLLPRFPGEKNNTRAQYLADPIHVVLGVSKETLDPLPDGEKGKVPDTVKQFREFWDWIPTDNSIDARLVALLAFRKKHVDAVRAWVGLRTKDKGNTGKPEPYAHLEDGSWLPLKNANIVGFHIDGVPLLVDDQTLPIWRDWKRRFEVKFREEVGFEPEKPKQQRRGTVPLQSAPHGVTRESICLVTGNVGIEVANIHKPEIKIPGSPPKGASFFSCGAEAFRSYGFKGGENASISIDAVASYALALEDLLNSDETCIRVPTGRFCFWSEKKSKTVGNKFSLLGTGESKAVADFLKEPFSGIDVALARSEQFMSVTLSANGGRVVVRDWLRVPLASAIESLASWFRDLAIISPSLETLGRPYRIHLLAASALKPPAGKPSSQYKQRFDGFVNELYRIAISKGVPPGHMLEPVLAVFQSALVTDSKTKPKYPFSQSRFALIKLILTRNTSGGFMPKAHLADTDDPAYNLGRLLMVFSKLQKAAHKSDADSKEDSGLKGPGVVERYYAEASSAPATAFPTLCKLHQHHLRKLEQKGEKGRKQAEAIRNKIGDILAMFRTSGTRGDGSPAFPRQLTLEAQGRFALGFYQQRTHDRIEAWIGKLLRDSKSNLGSDTTAATQSLHEAKRIAEKYGYPELIEIVNRASTH